jgi:hypothetical protein
MAITTIRATYALDVETVLALDRVARRWKVSKSEALRRAIRAVERETLPDRNAALDALDHLQKSLNLTPAKARAWAGETRAVRNAWSRRSETRGR